MHGILVDTKECSIVFCPPESSISFVKVLSWIRSVRNFAFSCCVSRKQIAFPEGFKSIVYEAFEHCAALTDIYIPSTITYLGDHAFDDCPKLTLWLHKHAYSHIRGCLREFSDINFELVEEEPCFRISGK